MALWGNNDNKFSGGTVSLNYTNLTVTGAGTSFGAAGAAAVGDIIRFGSAFGGTTGFSGDATIVSIAGTQSLKIDSTAGLSHVDITDENFQITQTPKFAALDPDKNQSSGIVIEEKPKKLVTTVTQRVAVGATIVQVLGNPSGSNVAQGDHAHYGSGTPIVFHNSTIELVGVSSVRFKKGVKATTFNYHATADFVINLNEIEVQQDFSVFHASDNIANIKVGDTLIVGGQSIGINTVSRATAGFHPFKRQIGLAATLTSAVSTGDLVQVQRGIAPGTEITFRGPEVVGGKDSQVVGVSTAGVGAASGTAFETGIGWVGVTTYMGTEGEMRVRKEILACVSGIQTGNTPIYDGNPLA